MTVVRYKCEDCGHEFEELRADVEEGPLACPNCGGLDIQLLVEEGESAA